MQETLRFIVVAVSAGVIGYIGWTIYEEGTQTTAARMSESVHLAQAQAEGMNASLIHIGSIGDDRQSMVSRASALSNTRTDTARVGEVANLEGPLAEWRPRYDTAKTSYAKFHSSIANAKSRATEYFAQQQVLTDRMRNPENQAKARLEDEVELALYRQWETQADQALEKANEIGIQLDDMDANLRKMELRANFVFDTSAFLEMPKAIDELNVQLFEFQVASENIKLSADSPFGTMEQ